MDVLFPLDTGTFNAANPYIVQLMEALVRLPRVSRIGFGYLPFYWPKPRWDVVHIQWPEALVGWQSPTAEQLSELERTLKRVSRHASIIMTVHNYEPQASMGAAGEQLFDIVHRHCVAFVHLGQASREWFCRKYADHSWCSQAIHRVIEHGDYSCYKNIPADTSLVPKSVETHRSYLVFGTIRDEEEIALAEQAFHQASLDKAKLVFAGIVSPKAKGHVAPRIKHKDIIRYHRRIASEYVAPLVESSYFMFVPRNKRLNSGVLPLAFTFGLPVIGPDDGVIGELIRATNNITYVGGDVNSAAAALRRAHGLSRKRYRAMSERVQAYCRQHMSWPALAAQHLALYQETRTLRRRIQAFFG
jgi:glycosyltransferase involved in cell wall biosynthesis